MDKLFLDKLLDDLRININFDAYQFQIIFGGSNKFSPQTMEIMNAVDKPTPIYEVK